MDPYIYNIMWNYKYKDEGKKFEIPEDIKDKINEATNHHVKNNRHYPKFYYNKEINLINKQDRDKLSKEIIDATKMPELDIAEMCADWFAVSVERLIHLKDWVDKNINIR